jgi:hypothetical protein
MAVFEKVSDERNPLLRSRIDFHPDSDCSAAFRDREAIAQAEALLASIEF